MAVTRTRKPRTTRTKADVSTEFEEVVSSRENEDELPPQAAALAKEHAALTRTAVQGLSVDSIVEQGAKFNLQVGRTITNLTEQCVAKAQELKTLQDAVKIEQEELERLYKLDIASASIQALIAEHEEKKVVIQKEIDDMHAAWAQEQTQHNKLVADRNKELTVFRQRESDDYEYKKGIERQRADDEFARKQLEAERNLNDKLVTFNKEIAERQAAMAKEEQELAVLKARFAQIDQEIDKAVAKGVAIATSVLKKDLEHAHIIEVNTLKNQLLLEGQKTASLNEANTKLAQQNELLQKAVEAAKQQVQDIAVKALESASGQQALNRVTEVVRENGSAPRGGKS